MVQHYVKVTKETLPSLTKGLKKVANQLLVDPMIFAVHPAKRVGEIIGVSETMVIRFCNQIGYTGFSDLQKEVRHHLLTLNQQDSSDEELEHLQHDIFSNMKKDLGHIRNSIEGMDVNSLYKTVDLIVKSEKVLIVGYYHLFTFAHWLSFNLNYVLGNAILYRSENDAGLLDLLPKNSSIVIFSFFRYAIDTIRLAEEAKERGLKVITITDSWVSPVAEKADLVISLSINESKTLINKGPVTISLINAILSEIMKRVESRGKIQANQKYYIKDGES